MKDSTGEHKLKTQRGSSGLLHRADLAETREALVEPEVLPTRVRAEVAHPAVDDLVRDDVERGAVPREQRWRHESEAGVLHPTVRERWRQHLRESRHSWDHALKCTVDTREKRLRSSAANVECKLKFAIEMRFFPE